MHLEVGQPSTPAPKGALAAAHAALDSDRIGYVAALGIPSLRERIARHYREAYGVEVSPDRPAANHFLSGNDYWSGHLGIDLAGATGDSVFASDSGVVVFSGGATGGYGYMIMIDHGNGYQTLYAHMSQVSAGCGQSVGQGQYIGAIGSTGNSTGSHLHFEVRYMGGFVSPWYVLPPP